MSAYHWFRRVCKTRVGEVVEHKGPVVAVDLDTSIATVLDIMKQKNIPTVGVYSSVDNFTGVPALRFGPKQYIGILNITDIMEILLQAPSVENGLSCSVSKLAMNAFRLGDAPYQFESKPLFFSMVEFSVGLRHAFIVGEDATVPKMLSQSDIVNYLIRFEDSMPHISSVMSMPIGLLCSRVTEHILPDTLMRDAIPKLKEHRVVPVVGIDGIVLATLSASDLLGRDCVMYALGSPITAYEFLAICHGGSVPPAVVLTDGVIMRDAVHVLCGKKIRRVWINPDESHPYIRVVSFTDILSELFRGQEEKE